MTLADAMTALGKGTSIAYLGFDNGRWHCDIKLPLLHYTATLVTADADTPDDALQNAVTRARTMFAKEHQPDTGTHRKERPL